MKLSKKIKNKIKQWEGCRLEAYRCPAGVWTIGYGHTGPDVRPTLHITQGFADKLFEDDIAAFAAKVERLIKAPVNANQFDALVSLAYNIGIGALGKSTLLKHVNANPNDPAIRADFMKWVHGGGKVLPGLVRRRTEEANHYFDPNTNA